MSRPQAPRPRLARALPDVRASTAGPRKRPGHRPDFDRLECRVLPTTAVGQAQFFFVQSPTAIAKGPGQSLWFAAGGGTQVGILRLGDGPDSWVGGLELEGSFDHLAGMVLGPDGAMWAVDGRQVDRLDGDGESYHFTVGENLETFAVGTDDDYMAGGELDSIAVGSDGALWVAGLRGSIGRVGTDGSVTLFPLRDSSEVANAIAAGPDGALWFTEAGRIGRIGVDGSITEFEPPASPPSEEFDQITAGPDGALWFTSIDGPDPIGRVTTTGQFTLFATPTANAHPSAIVAGDDGALWFTEAGVDGIGRIGVDGTITEYGPHAPGGDVGFRADPAVYPWAHYDDPDGNPGSLAVGADGALYYTTTAPEPVIARFDPTLIAPFQATAAPISGYAGGPEGGTVATFRPIVAGQPAPDYSATIEWGDGEPATAGTIEPDGDGGFSVDSSHTYYGREGIDQVTVTIVDSVSGRAATTHGTATFLQVPVTPGLAEFPLPPPSNNAGHDFLGGKDHLFPTFSLDPAATSEPGELATGPDGAVWFVEQSTDSIGRIAPDGTISEFNVSDATHYRPRSIAAGPDGSLWIAYHGGAVGRLSTDGVATVIPIPTAPGAADDDLSSQINGPIAVGPDGDLWVTESGSRIVRVSPDGTTTVYSIPGDSSITDGYEAGSMVAGPDGAIWFTATDRDAIVRIDGAGNVSEFPTLTDAESAYGTPHALTVGPDGDLWFFQSNDLIRMAPDGSLTSFHAADQWGMDYFVGDAIQSMTAGPDGKLWFASPDDDRLGDVAADGHITLVQLPNGSRPTAVAIGPDGNLWISEDGAVLGGGGVNFSVNGKPAAIGRLTLDQPLVGSPEILQATTGTPFSGFVAIFDDPNLADGDPGDPSRYTASIDWGDGATSTGVVASTGFGSFTVEGSHSYAASGGYSVTIALAGPPAPSPLPSASPTVVSDGVAVDDPGDTPPLTLVPVVIVGFQPGEFSLGAPSAGDGLSGSGSTPSPIPIPIPDPVSPVPSGGTSSGSPVPVAIPVAAAPGGGTSLASPVVGTSGDGSGSTTATVQAIGSAWVSVATATAPVASATQASSATVATASASDSTPLPLANATTANEAAASTSIGRASTVVASSSLRPIASTSPSGLKSTMRRPRRQVARAKPAGPRASASPRPAIRAAALPEGRSRPDPR